MSTTTDQQRGLAADVAEYLDLADQIEQLKARQDQIKARLRDLLAPGVHDGPNGTSVRISPNRRFNPTRAAEVLSPELVMACSETVVSSAKAKKILAPLVFESLMTDVGEPRVSVS